MDSASPQATYDNGDEGSGGSFVDAIAGSNGIPQATFQAGLLGDGSTAGPTSGQGFNGVVSTISAHPFIVFGLLAALALVARRL